MREVSIANCSRVALVDDEDFQRISLYSWNLCKSRCGGLRTTINKGGKYSTIIMARLITGAPRGVVVDHEDHDPLNNQRRNLRICDYSQNSANSLKRKSNTSSSYKGVCIYSSGQIVATIKFKGKKIHLGTFKSQVGAARAYDSAALKYFGEFAHTNF